MEPWKWFKQKSHLQIWFILISLISSSLACNLFDLIRFTVDPGPMWLERVDVVPQQGSGKFSVSVLVLSHTREDTILCHYGIHSTHGETVYRQIIPPNSEAETVTFEFTLTQSGSYDLTCTPEKLSIPASTTFIVTDIPAVIPSPDH